MNLDDYRRPGPARLRLYLSLLLMLVLTAALGKNATAIWARWRP